VLDSTALRYRELPVDTLFVASEKGLTVGGAVAPETGARTVGSGPAARITLSGGNNGHQDAPRTFDDDRASLSGSILRFLDEAEQEVVLGGCHETL